MGDEAKTNDDERVAHEKDKRVIVRFDRLRTEYGWMLWADRFALKFVPAWFNFLGWILILAAFQYMWKKSHHWSLAILIAVSSVGIWRYLTAIFWRYEFRGLPILKSKHSQSIASGVIAGIATFLGWLMALLIANVFALHQ